jgi:hypothetical protein
VGEDAPVAASPSAESEPPASPEEPADPNALDNFELSAGIKSQLRAKGINSLFAIQAQTFALALAGNDVVGRARTGCGKTLAFVLPIVESLMRAQGSAKRAYGRAPAVIVLAPTRELAKQVGGWGLGGWGAGGLGGWGLGAGWGSCRRELPSRQAPSVHAEPASPLRSAGRPAVTRLPHTSPRTSLTPRPLAPPAQVHGDFEHMGQAAGLQTLCLYGGTPYDSQTYVMNKGVDVIVGTPGRCAREAGGREGCWLRLLACGPAAKRALRLALPRLWRPPRRRRHGVRAALAD